MTANAVREARDLRPLLAPRSVAIVGASARPDSIAARPLANLQRLGYRGSVALINPQRAEIGGIRCFASLDDVTEAPELAMIVLPTKQVLPAVEACARRGVRAAIVFTAGFAETGPEGRSLQERLGRLAKDSGMIVCGPNSIGVLNFVDSIPLTFGPVADMEKARPGQIALVSQSGGFVTGIVSRAIDANVSLNYAISTGNEVDLTVAEVLTYLVNEPSTRALVAVVESVRDSAMFLEAADQMLALGKPLVFLKIGKTESGAAAARSHTGALAGSYASLQAALRQRGIIEAGDVDDVVDLAAACAAGHFPAGPRLGILTESGGAGAVAADAVETFGLSLVSFSSESAERLRQFLPSFAARVDNPFDATAQILESPRRFGEIAATLAQDAGVDGIVTISPGSGKAGQLRAESLSQNLSGLTKPVHTVVLAGSLSAAMHDVLRENGMPVFRSPAKAVEAMAGLRRFERARGHLASRRSWGLDEGLRLTIRDGLRRIGMRPTEHAAKRFLAQMGIAVLDERLVGSVEEAVSASQALGFPIALKIQSPDIVHKTEIGGVRLNLKDASEVAMAYELIMSNVRLHMPAAEIVGMLVAPMVEAPIEFLAGIHHDISFGPQVVFGLGGIWSELVRDVVMRPAPLLAEEIPEMMRELRSRALLDGARGFPALPMERLQQLLLKLSEIAVSAEGELSALDINPLVPLADGRLLALDASLFPRVRRQP